jgi:hypothetical protein
MQARSVSKLLFAALLCLAAAPAMAATDEALSGTHSTNWSGYAALRHADYTGVGATWVVPTPQEDGAVPLATDATWIGIGGIKKDDLIQAGTQAITKNGKTSYRAWYELLPDYQKAIPLEVRGGDTVQVMLSEFSPDLWLLAFSNQTTGSRYYLVLPYESSRSTAEWIQEMPHLSSSGDSVYAPLDRFGTVTFRDAYAIIRGSNRNLGRRGSSLSPWSPPTAMSCWLRPPRLPKILSASSAPTPRPGRSSSRAARLPRSPLR